MSAGRESVDKTGEDGCGSNCALQLVGRARKKWGGIVGAQHVGTERGFGGTKARRERGRRRWLAARIKAAVVKVIAKETEKRSCKAVCGCGCDDEHLENKSIKSSKVGWRYPDRSNARG